MKLNDCEFKNDIDRECLKVFKRTIKDLYFIGLIAKKNKYSMNNKTNEYLLNMCNKKKNIRTPKNIFGYFYSFIHYCSKTGYITPTIKLLYIMRLLKTINNETLIRRMESTVKNTLNGYFLYHSYSDVVNDKEKILIDSYSNELEKTINEKFPNISRNQIRVFFNLLKYNVKYPDIPL